MRDGREGQNGPAAAGGALLLADLLAAEQAAGQGAPDHQAHALAAQHRHDLALQVAAGDGVVGLQALEPGQAEALGDAQGLHDLPGGPVGHADIADVAVLHEGVQGADGFLDGRRRVEAVHLVEVDVIELQALEAGLHRADEVQARVAAAVGAGAGGAIPLGGDDDAVARHMQVAEGLAGDLLG